MANKYIADYIVKVHRQCPHLMYYMDGDYPVVNFEQLDKEATSYSIRTMPTEQVIQQTFGYIRKKLDFIIEMRGLNLKDSQRLANSGFYEDLNWWYNGNRATGEQGINTIIRFKSDPIYTLDPPYQAERFELITGGTLEQTDSGATTGYYQAQARLIYLEMK